MTMKKKIKTIFRTLIIGAFALYNISFIMNKDLSFTFFSPNIEALASDEGSEVIGTKYQIMVGCDGQSFAHFKVSCCRGSRPTCVDQCPTGRIYNGCSAQGYLPL